jgi:hypothetical protein
MDASGRCGDQRRMAGAQPCMQEIARLNAYRNHETPYDQGRA